MIPATWEAEAGESLEPRKHRLQGDLITPLQSSLGNRVRLHLKKKKNTHTHTHKTTHIYLGNHLTDTSGNLPGRQSISLVLIWGQKVFLGFRL